MSDNVTNKKKSKGILPCLIGNILEWFDHGLYAGLSTLLAMLFFPSSDPFTSTLKYYLTFAAGFIARPLGNIMFGYIGDTYGRKKALVWSLVLMSIPTFIVGLLPTYATIGVLSSIALIIIRIIQGFAVGGEFIVSFVYLAEQAPPKHRAFYTSLADFASPVGILLGQVMAMSLVHIFGYEMFMQWGWRIPFLSSALILIFGLYLRKNLEETEIFEKHAVEHVSLTRSDMKKIVGLAGVAIFSAVNFYLLLTFIPDYFKSTQKINTIEAIHISMLSNISMSVAIPIFGLLSDRTSHKFTIILGMFFSVLGLYYVTTSAIDYNTILMYQGIFGMGLGVYFAGRGALFVETFATKIRCRAIAIGFSISHSVIPGIMPALALALTAHYDFVCLVYISGASLILAIIGSMTLQDKTGMKL